MKHDTTRKHDLERGIILAEPCPRCGGQLEQVAVSVWGAKSKALSRQCEKCGYFDFDQVTGQKVLEELRQNPLRIKQSVVGISGNRLGIYLNKHIVESLKIKKGDIISVTVPDKKHILIALG
jgi:hypothetical protein